MERYADNGSPRRERRIALQWCCCFTALFLLTVAVPHHWLPLPAQVIGKPFDWLAQAVGRTFWKTRITERNVSDGIGMQAHVLNLAWLSILGVLCWNAGRFRRKGYPDAGKWLVIVARYFLSWQLLIYGLNKIFKWQFYLPEPNIQYTPVGALGADMLYWTAMGTSRVYSIFLGGLEAAAAALLLFRRTALIGALLAAGILLNVLFVNIGFGITVKILSAFLLFQSGIIIWAFRGRLRTLLLLSCPVVLPAAAVCSKTHWQRGAKWIVVLIILSDAFYPYIRSRNFNDDTAPRPPLHGAYKILSATPAAAKWQRFFIHRRGYLILQDTAGAFSDFETDMDTAAHAFWISAAGDTAETALYYRLAKDSSLELHGLIGSDTVSFAGKLLPLRWKPH